MSDHPRPSGSNERERVYEQDGDPAEEANRPLEPRYRPHDLHDADVPHPEDADRDAHGALNTPVGDVDPVADSDPYEQAVPEDDADRASGTRGRGQGAEE